MKNDLIPFSFLADVSDDENGELTRCDGTIETLFSPSGLVHWLQIPVMNLCCHLTGLADGPMKTAAIQALNDN